jgi:hypothetical protein
VNHTHLGSLFASNLAPHLALLTNRTAIDATMSNTDFCETRGRPFRFMNLPIDI